MSLAAQYKSVKSAVTGSPVQMYGDQSFANEPIGVFQGVVDYTVPSDDPLDFVYWFRNRFPQAGEFSQYNLSETKDNIIASESKKTKSTYTEAAPDVFMQ